MRNRCLLHYRYAKRSSASQAARTILRSASPAGGRKFSTSAVRDASPVGRKLSRQTESGRDTPDNDAGAEAIRFLLEKGANVNATDKYRLSALHHAAIRGNNGAVKELLAAEGVEKEPKDVQDSTPLHIAATYGHKDVAKTLLAEGANPRALDRDKRTPLHEACLEGNDRLVSILLDEGAATFGEDYARTMMKDRDEEGSTPLLLGVGSGREEVARMLLERKADVNSSNRDAVHPVHSAARTGDLDILRVIVESGRARLDARNALLQTPMILAAQNNHSDVVKYLHDSGGSIDLWDRDGNTPLMAAAAEGHAEVVQTLMDLGARLDLVDRDDRTALFQAAQEDYPEVLEVILADEMGRELLDANDVYDNLPIHAASAAGNAECVRILLEAGADVDNKNEDERTPLHLAAINGRSRVAEIILK